MKTFRYLAVIFLCVGIASAVAGPANIELQPSPAPADENSHDIFSYETTYTFNSDFKESKLGHGDSLYDDFSYDHRFLITGKWYLRLGVEYERYDFDGTDNGLPDHLQAAYAHIAYEYVVKDFPGVGIELDPGVYFQDHVSGDSVRHSDKSVRQLSAQKGQNLRGRRLGLVVIPRPAGCARWRNHLGVQR